ncbi:hypothetical protein ES703_20370 [subsurface metagenome]
MTYYSVKFDLIVWKGGSLKRSPLGTPYGVPAFAGTSLGMASPVFTIPKAFATLRSSSLRSTSGFEAATQPWE